MGARRGLVGLLSIGAVLVPAAGLAYLGTVSYLADRDLVEDERDESTRVASMLAHHVTEESERALDAVARMFDAHDASVPPEVLSRLRQEHPLARYPFRMGSDSQARYAFPHPFKADQSPVAVTGFRARVSRQCPTIGFDACMRAKQAAQRRLRRLERARERELVGCREATQGCVLTAAERRQALKAYAPLVASDDTGPDALLGLARLALSAADRSAAVSHFQLLGARFGERLDPEGVSYALISQLGVAEATGTTDDHISVYRGVMARRYRAPPSALVAIAERLRSTLRQRELEPEVAAELAAIDQRLADAHTYSRLASDLAVESETVAQTAVPIARGRQALRDGAQTIVYRRQSDGAVVGYVVDRAALEAVVARASMEERWRDAQAVIQPLGAPDTDGVRTLATAAFGGAIYPHLQLGLVIELGVPDPIDQIVEQRGRRHLLLTGGLVGLLILGVVATVRSAARERELARLKSDFVSTVSHELKTPLTSIRMFAEMLQEGVAGGDRAREARYHSIIVKESERLGLLIANVLDYSQIERGTRRYSTGIEPLDEVAREAVEAFQRLREGGNSDVAFSVTDDVQGARARVDRPVVVQSLLNLLANAVKYGGGDSPIEVSVQRGSGGLVVSVRDRGPGIPRGEHARIFREFYRAPEAYSSGVEGTGLGLALVKRHVEALGGRVELDSVVGKGTVFSLIFPEVAA